MRQKRQVEDGDACNLDHRVAVGNHLAFLIQHGARNDVKDVSSLCPSQLANRQGRRDSKELIEEKTGYNPDLIAEMEKEMAMGGARRGSMRRGSLSNRASKETVGPPEAATGA